MADVTFERFFTGPVKCKMILKKKLIVGLNIKGNPNPVYNNKPCLRSVKVKLHLLLEVIKLENA